MKKVYHASKSLFQKFNNNYMRDIGFHFGTREQAVRRVTGYDTGEADNYLYECEIAVEKMLGPEIIDLGQWDDFGMIDEYFNPARDNYETFTPEEFKKIRCAADFREALIKKGYDGISYLNTFEESGAMGGESFIVFDSKNVHIKHIYKIINGAIATKELAKKGRSR
jgi:hypothetical protein